MRLGTMAPSTYGSEIKRMLDELDRRGVLDHTVVIIAGDHGEQLGEHDLYGHSNSLYLPSLHVPLMVFDARGDGKQRVVRSVVSLRDMAATVLDLAGVMQRRWRFRGIPFLDTGRNRGRGKGTQWNHRLRRPSRSYTGDRRPKCGIRWSEVLPCIRW